jgi:hypothetical protein
MPSANVAPTEASANTTFHPKDAAEVREADAHLPALREVRARGVDEVALSLVGLPPVALALDAVAARVVDQRRASLDRAAQSVRLDQAAAGRYGQRRDLLRPGRRLRCRQYGEAGRPQHLARHAHLGAGHRCEPGRVARLDLLGLGVHEEEDQPVALQRRGQAVLGRAGRLPYGAGLDRRDGGPLVAAVAVAEVRERGAHRVEDREHLEGDQEDGAGDQVLGRDEAAGQVEVGDGRGGQAEDHQGGPRPGGDQGRRRVHQERRRHREHHDPADQERRGDLAAGPRGSMGSRGRTHVQGHDVSS